MLEQGAVVFLPNLSFSVQPSERDIFSPAILSSSKNTSYDPAQTWGQESTCVFSSASYSSLN